jgi:hypothetical protein
MIKFTEAAPTKSKPAAPKQAEEQTVKPAPASRKPPRGPKVKAATANGKKTAST